MTTTVFCATDELLVVWTCVVELMLDWELFVADVESEEIDDTVVELEDSLDWLDSQAQRYPIVLGRYGIAFGQSPSSTQPPPSGS